MHNSTKKAGMKLTYPKAIVNKRPSIVAVLLWVRNLRGSI
jgi:hypothetical protein